MGNLGPELSSHKFAKKGGFRCEIALCTQTGDIVWIHGPFPCGWSPDITIFRKSLMHHLGTNEHVEADDGYVEESPEFVKCPKSFTNPEETLFMQLRVRSRQETVNKRFKDWLVLSGVYQHKIGDHGDIVRAIVVMTQIKINNGEKLFQTGYRGPPYNSFDDDDDDDDNGQLFMDEDGFTFVA